MTVPAGFTLSVALAAIVIAGTNVTSTDTLIAELQILRVEAPGVIEANSDQTVSVVYPVPNPEDSVTFSIFALVTDGVDISKAACVVTRNECAAVQLVSQLPAAGENPRCIGP